MKVLTKQNMVTMVVVFGAMIFGMVLAGGLGLTPKGQTSPEPSPAAPAVASTAGGLPSFADLAELVSPAVVTIESSAQENRSAWIHFSL